LGAEALAKETGRHSFQHRRHLSAIARRAKEDHLSTINRVKQPPIRR
jgi:hypothetical protein